MSKPKKNRKGRPRSTGQRHPSGKVKQPTERALAELNRSVVLEARQRVYGLSEEDARRDEAFVVLGRLFFTREISRQQYDDGWRYAEIVANYRRAIMAKGVPSAGDLDRSRGHDGSDGTDPAYVARCKRDIAIYKQVRRSILEAPDPLAQTIIDAVVIEGKDMPSFVGTLRIALNAVGHAITVSRAA